MWAFDIQAEAIQHTSQCLYEAGLNQRVRLIHDSHVNIGSYITDSIKAAMFNLGYLPGGNRVITTCGPDTVAGLNCCIQRLASGGLITIVAYPGHPGGFQEMEEILHYISGLDQKEYEAWQLNFINQQNHPPGLMVVSKRCGGSI